MNRCGAFCFLAAVVTGACVSGLPRSQLTGDDDAGPPATGGAAAAGAGGPGTGGASTATGGYAARGPSSGGTGGAAGITGPGSGGRATGGTGGPPTGPFAFVTDSGTPPNLAANASYLFWANTSRRMLMKIGVDGTGPGTPLAPLTTPNTWVAADAQNVYWNGGIPGSPVGIFKLANDSMMPTFLTGETDDLRGIAVNANGVYWATAVGAVMRAGLDGSARLVLVPSGFVSSLVVDEQNVYWVGDCIMVGPAGCQSINKVAIWGGTAVEIVRLQVATAGLAVDPMFIYWADLTNAAVMRFPFDGVAPELALPFPVVATSLAVDPSGLYWTEQMGRVFGALPGGPTPRIIGDSGGAPARSVTLSATNVYWLATANPPLGTIMKAPK
jgi:hypothetical protein